MRSYIFLKRFWLGYVGRLLGRRKCIHTWNHVEESSLLLRLLPHQTKRHRPIQLRQELPTRIQLPHTCWPTERLFAVKNQFVKRVLFYGVTLNSQIWCKARNYNLKGSSMKLSYNQIEFFPLGWNDFLLWKASNIIEKVYFYDIWDMNNYIFTHPT